MEIGSIITVFLFGIVTLQTHMYFERFSKDRIYFKILVRVLFCVYLSGAYLRCVLPYFPCFSFRKRNKGYWDLVRPDSDKNSSASEFILARFLKALRTWKHNCGDIRGISCNNYLLRQPIRSNSPSCTRSRRHSWHIYCDDYPGEFCFPFVVLPLCPSFALSDFLLLPPLLDHTEAVQRRRIVRWPPCFRKGHRRHLCRRAGD